MTEQHGYAGRILNVDLSSGSITDMPTSDYTDRFLGGRGIAAKIYWDEVSPDIKPFSPDNRLLFMTGPLAGFSGIAGSRWTVCGKSPTTNPERFSYTNMGGSWGAHLKFGGYDGIVINGESDKPAYLSIHDGHAEIRDASTLWGQNTVEVRETLKAELGSSVRVKRQEELEYESVISSLRRFKDDVKEVSTGYECGLGVKDFGGFEVGDVLEFFRKERAD